jgi:hypothetical protein
VAGAIGGLTESLLNNSPADDLFKPGSVWYTGTAMLSGGLLAEAFGHDGVTAALAAQNAAQNNRQLHPDQRKAIEELEKQGKGNAEDLTAVLCVLQNCDIDGMSGFDAGMGKTYQAGIALRDSDPVRFRELEQAIRSAGLLGGQFTYAPGSWSFMKDAFGLRLQERVYTPFDKATTLPEDWGEWFYGAGGGLGNMNPHLQVPAPLGSLDQERGAIFATGTAALGVSIVFAGGGSGFGRTGFGARGAGSFAELARGAEGHVWTTILGENMMGRVIPFAEQTGARTLGFGVTAEQWAAMSPAQRWRLNDGMLRSRVNEGDLFRYIGQDPGRNPAFRTQFDLTRSELLRLESLGVSYQTVPPSEVIRVLGKP